MVPYGWLNIEQFSRHGANAKVRIAGVLTVTNITGRVELMSLEFKVGYGGMRFHLRRELLHRRWKMRIASRKKAPSRAFHRIW
jgi:hypothetical protein